MILPIIFFYSIQALRLSQFSLAKTNVGQIINLLTNDANRFDRAIPFIPYIIIAPLQIVSVTGVLWIYLGPSCLSLPVLLILLVPLQSWVGKIFGKLRVSAAKNTDDRVRIINEAINGIQVIYQKNKDMTISEIKVPFCGRSTEGVLFNP